MNQPIASADSQIDNIVATLAIQHPELKLSYGYVGNVYRDGTDDRSFRIFTNRRDDTGRSVSYHLGGINNLPNALARLPQLIGPFIARAKTCNAA